MDRKGLIHDVTKVLCELELTIQRLKVMTTPDGKVLDLFFITDPLDLLHTNIRREETCEHLSGVLGECCISCELQLAGPEYECQQGFSCISEEIAAELFSSEISTKEDGSPALSTDVEDVKKAVITVDNLTSPAHTLLQIQCLDQKALIYDILKVSKDCNIWAEVGRHSTSDRDWEVYRFRLDETRGISLTSNRAKLDIVDRVRRTLMGWRISDLRGPDTLNPPISNTTRFKNLILRKCNLTGTLPTSLAPGEGDQELKVFYLTRNVLSGRQCEAGEGNAKTGKRKVLLEQDNRETNKARRDRCQVDNGLDHSGFAV